MKKYLKPLTNLKMPWCAIVTALALCCMSSAKAQPYTNIFKGFDSFAEAITGLGGIAGVTLDWIDTDGCGTNGCMKLDVPWVDTTNGWQEVQLGWADPQPPFAWPGLVMAPYATVEYDLKVQGSPNPDANGTY